MLKKAILLMISLVMTVTSFTGCKKADGQNTGNKASEQAVSDKPLNERPQVTITIFDRGWVPAEEGSYEENRWTKLLREKSGVNVKWIAIPKDSFDDKINILMASGNPPDMITGYNLPFMFSMAEEGGIIPLDELLKKHGANILKDTPKQLLDAFTIKGKLYAMPLQRAHTGMGTLLYRKDWLEKLNLKIPTTTEEFYQVAKAFAEKDPDGNGKADTFGMNMTGKNNSDPSYSLLYSFMENTGWIKQKDGTLTHADISDGRKEYLKYIKKMYDEKIIDKEYVVDTQGNKGQEYIETGRTGFVNTIWGNVDKFNEALKKNNAGAELIPMDPPKGPQGLQGFQRTANYKFFTVITNTCKNPEEGVKFLDFMIREGYKYTDWGIEGENYKVQDGFRVAIDPALNEKTRKYLNGDYTYLGLGKTDPKQFIFDAGSDEQKKHLAQLKADAFNLAEKFGKGPLLEATPALPSLSEYSADLGKWRDEITAKLILGQVPFEEGWNNFVSEWKKRGGQKQIDEMNEWYKKK
jgi:putative aldouronate transport system substrate-binding protein